MIAGLMLVFLIAGPLLVALVVGWTRTAGERQQHAEAAWRQVTARVQAGQSAPRYFLDGPQGPFEVRANWTAPDGQNRRNWVPVGPGTTPRSVRIWVSRSGSPTGPPLQRTQLEDRMAIAGLVTVYALGLLACLVGGTARSLLGRRRLAEWDRAWRDVEPRWSRPR